MMRSPCRAGDRVHFARLLQRFLQGLKSSLDGNHSYHAVVVGMTRGAKSLCDGLRAQYSHHCALSSASRGHEGDDEEVQWGLTSCFNPSLQKHVPPSSFCVHHKHAGPATPSSCCDEICHMQGDSWQLAAELHKLELVHEVLAFGYSAVYVELDTVFFHNPMQHLLSLQVCHYPSPCSLGIRLSLDPKIPASTLEGVMGRMPCECILQPHSPLHDRSGQVNASQLHTNSCVRGSTRARLR